MLAVERPARTAVGDAQAAGVHTDDDLAVRIAVHEGVLKQVAHNTRRERRVHPHGQLPLFEQRKADPAVGIDLPEVLGRTAHQGIHIDRLGLGELPVLDLRKQQQ